MDRVEVVCVTMGQKDLTIADKMHITGDAVFGNQAGGYRKETQSDAGRTLRMITTDTRGVGVNRNIALLHATGDILLFADDDICYADGYADGVRRAYAQHPDADMILFSLDITQGGRVIRRIKNRDGPRSAVWDVRLLHPPRQSAPGKHLVFHALRRRHELCPWGGYAVFVRRVSPGASGVYEQLLPRHLRQGRVHLLSRL